MLHVPSMEGLGQPLECTERTRPLNVPAWLPPELANLEGLTARTIRLTKSRGGDGAWPSCLSARYSLHSLPINHVPQRRREERCLTGSESRHCRGGSPAAALADGWPAPKVPGACRKPRPHELTECEFLRAL